MTIHVNDCDLKQGFSHICYEIIYHEYVLAVICLVSALRCQMTLNMSAGNVPEQPCIFPPDHFGLGSIIKFNEMYV